MLKAAIIGLGNAGFLYDNKKTDEILTHFKAYKNLKNIDIECVCDSNDNKYKYFKSLHNLPIYKNYNEMFKKHKIDILSIATNDENHATILKDLVNYDIKYIFCEKPISHNLDNLIEIQNKYKKRNIPIYVNYFRKWDDIFIKIGETINQLNKDDFIKIDINYSKGLIHSGTHYIDFLIDWFGMPIRWSKSIPIEKISHYDFTSSFSLFFNFKGKEIIVNMLGEKVQSNFDKISVFLKNSKIEIIGAREVNYYKISNNLEILDRTEYTEFNIIILKIIEKITNQSDNSNVIFADNFMQSYKVLEYATEINKHLF